MACVVENAVLRACMESAGLTQSELAHRLNQRIEALTGQYGKLQDRHVRNWLTGKTRWPQERQRVVLRAEFGMSAEALGFVPRAAKPAPPEHKAQQEDDVRRRDFTTAATMAAAALIPGGAASAAPRVGMADADRLEKAFCDLVSFDNQHGGTINLETRATAFAHHAMELQHVGQATERVRSRLYYLAAAFTGSALWAAVDAHQPDKAQSYLDRALTLAGLSGNEEIQLRLWSHASLLAAQQGRLNDALAATRAAAATGACRRDPLYRSLAAARAAGIHAQAGERTAALRSMDKARAAFERADDRPRPSWMGFYDRAELDGLAGLALLRSGAHQQAEACWHRTLARLRPQYRRNRAYYSAQLALAQLRQGDAEQACAGAISALSSHGDGPLPGRTLKLLHTFDRELTATIGDSRCAGQWAEHYTYREGHRP